MAMDAALNFSAVKTPIQFQFMPKSKSSFRYPSIHIRRQQHNLVVFQPPRLPRHSSSLRLRCEAGKVDVLQSQNSYLTPDEIDENEFNCVIKFGSVDSADRMREAAEFIRNFVRLIRSFESFEEKRPVIVLSAMGETNNKLQLAADKAVSCDVSSVPDIEELTFIKDLHLRTADELGIDREIIAIHLFDLEQHLKVISMIEEMNPGAEDNVVSFGERMSSRIFTAYLNKIGVKAREYDSFEIGYNFTNVDILEATYPDVAKRLRGELISDPAIPIVIGSLEKPPKLPGHGSYEAGKVDVLQSQNSDRTLNKNEFNCVIKFGSSYVDSADRMREAAEFICNFDHFIRSFESFEEKRPVIVLSAMGKTTNKLQLAGEKVAASCDISVVSNLEELTFIKDFHLRTMDELGIDREIISKHLCECEHTLDFVFLSKEMNPRNKDYVVSCGERMSTIIFATYLNKIGVKAREYDSYYIGFITNDDFTNADIFETTYSAIAKRLRGDWISDSSIPIITGSPGKGLRSCAVITFGWGCNDVIATTIGKALGLREIQVWRNFWGINEKSTYRPRRFKNIYNTKARGTSLTRYMSEVFFPKLLNLSELVFFILFPKLSRLFQILLKLLNLFFHKRS